MNKTETPPVKKTAKKKETLFQALAKFQQEVPTIHKATQGYGYSYADLPTIFEAINPVLKKHGLGFTQLIDGQQIKTIVFHCESGETLESNTDIPQDVILKGMNDFQVLGSAITYIRRYSLSAILGIVTDKDTDAHGEQAPKQKKATPKKKQAESLTPERFEKALDAMAKGDVDYYAIEKYNLTKQQREELLQATLDVQENPLNK
jgi:hypothetical protein